MQKFHTHNSAAEMKDSELEQQHAVSDVKHAHYLAPSNVACAELCQMISVWLGVIA